MVSVSENNYIFLFDSWMGPLTGATTLDQSEPGSNGNEEVLCIPQRPRSSGSPSVSFVSYPGPPWGVVLPLCRDAVGIFYSPS